MRDKRVPCPCGLCRRWRCLARRCTGIDPDIDLGGKYFAGGGDSETGTWEAGVCSAGFLDGARRDGPEAALGTTGTVQAGFCAEYGGPEAF